MPVMPFRLTRVLAMLIGLTTPAMAAEAAWPDQPVARLEALALLQSLDLDLLTHDSATATLERWCAAHRFADPAKVRADRVIGVDKPAGADQRVLLGVGPAEPIRYRRVRLACGSHVLSEADNWYVPARLTPEMNRLLDTTDIAFGRAVEALRFQRRTLSAELLWRPLAEDWATGGETAVAPSGPLGIPDDVIRHRAVLTLPDGTPFSTVVETYKGEVLAFPRPRL